MRYDPEVCRRQAFGDQFAPRASDATSVRRLLEGRLRLPPHPEWAMPEELTWDEDPFGQRNWVFQVQTLRWLDPARRRGLDGDAAARALWLRTTTSWIRANPVDAPTCDAAWGDMQTGLRALVLTVGLPLADGEQRTLLLSSLRDHGTWLVDHLGDGRANHALHHAQGLFVVARLLQEPSWERQAVDRLTDLLELAYDEQGVNEEGAPAYHLMNLSWWRTALRRLAVEGLEIPASAERLERASLALAHATRPDGLLETIGDTGRSSPSRVGTPELEWASSAGTRGTPPDRPAMVLDRGYVFGRSTWGDDRVPFAHAAFYSLRFGRPAPTHGHLDRGSVTFFARGRPWLVDSGKYGYNRDARRDFFVGRSAHNVVVLPDQRFRTGGEARLTRAHLSADVDDLEIDESGYRDAELTRRVVFCRDAEVLVVVDRVRRSDSGAVEQLWHLPADVTASVAGPAEVLIRSRDTIMRLSWPFGPPDEIDVVEGQTDPLQGWVSTDWGECTPAPVILARFASTAVDTVAVLAGADLSVLGARPATDGHVLVLRSDGSGRSWTVGLSPGGATVTSDGASALR